MDGEKTAGDSEALGAIAGMIEAYGTPGGNATVWQVEFSEAPTQPYYLVEYCHIGTLPDGTSLVRRAFNGEAIGDTYFFRSRYALHRSRADALAAAIAGLHERRRRIADHISKAEAEIATLTGATVSPADLQVEDAA